MSSAILYLAIVAIWACVLIPRWLRRDSARGAAAPAPADRQDRLAEPSRRTARAPAAEPEAAAEDDPATRPTWTTRPSPPPLTGPERAAESRRRMLAARRRLLLMLIGLEIAAIALALVGLAAVWVVVPPTIMLGGLPAAAPRGRPGRRRAGAARGRGGRAGPATARRGRGRCRRSGPPRPRARPPTGIAAAAAALAAKFAAAPVPADYEDAPRPRLRPRPGGQVHHLERGRPSCDEDYYDSYQVPRLRAVGD